LQRDPEAYLWDVVQSADDIVAFTAGLTEATNLKSAITQAAVERKFEIIGEALNLLAKSNPDIASRIPEFADTRLRRDRPAYRVDEHAPAAAFASKGCSGTARCSRVKNLIGVRSRFRFMASNPS
jgi:uncharacterized protein with HEPN domain